jgi:hypothetical protein
MNTINTLQAEPVFTYYTHVLIKSQPARKLKNVKKSKSDFLFFGRLIFAGGSYRVHPFDILISCLGPTCLFLQQSLIGEMRVMQKNG